MAALVASFVCGLLFGIGLVISGMSQPAKVLNFLDIFGVWDPSLLVVMAAALVTSGAGYALVRRNRRPLLADRCAWPTSTDIDPPLIVGAGLFGIGWGLVGLCPGPALVDLASLSPQVFVFVVSMTAGIVAHDLWRQIVIPLRTEGVAASPTTDG